MSFTQMMLTAVLIAVLLAGFGSTGAVFPSSFAAGGAGTHQRG